MNKMSEMDSYGYNFLSLNRSSKKLQKEKTKGAKVQISTQMVIQTTVQYYIIRLECEK